MDKNSVTAALAPIDVRGLVAGESTKETKGFAGDIKAKGEAGAKKAEGLAVSGEEKEKIREQVARQIADQRKIGRETAKAVRESAEASRDVVRQMAQSERGRLEPEHESAKRDLSQEQRTLGDMLGRHASTLKEINDKINDPKTNGAEVPVLQERMKAAEAAQASEMRTQQNKIEQARTHVKDVESKLANVDQQKFTITRPDGTTLETSLAEAQNALGKTPTLDDYDNDTEKEVRAAVKTMTENAEKGASEAAGEVGRRQVSLLRRLVTDDDEKVADEVRKKFKHKIGTSSIKSALEDYLKEEGGGAKEEPKESGTHGIGAAGLPPHS